MILTCVGTGTAAPERDRACSGYFVEAHGLRLLMDCGPGVLHNLAGFGLDWRQLTHLAITHFHNDHIGDVPALFFAWKWGLRPARTQPLTIVGPKGTRQLLHRMGDVFGTHVSEPDFDVELHELGDGARLQLTDSLRLSTCATRHTPESLAYRIDGDGRSLCYTGDTGTSEAVAVFAQGVGALLAECSLPDDEPLDMHLTPSQVAELARLALPRQLLITHVYPQLSRGTIPDRVRAAGWHAAVRVVDDGERIEL